MGNKAGKALALKEKEVKRYASSTMLQESEIKELFGTFCCLKSDDIKGAAAGTDDLHVTQSEFQAALGTRKDSKSLFLQRIFTLMDSNHDGIISFEDFLVGISLLAPNAVPEKKMKFTFAIYDTDSTGRITPANMRQLLASLLADNDASLTPPQIDALVAHTFATEDTNKDGVIDYAEYSAMVARNPALLRSLTLSVSELVATG